MLLSTGVVATIDGVLRAASGSAAANAQRVATLRAVRVVHDPLALCGIGLILTQHRHDPQPIAVRFHQVQGLGIISLGCAGFVCASVHARMPRADGAATAIRMLTATLWLLNGAWLYHMACFLYLLPHRRGLHHLLWPTANADEAVCVYLAVDGWLAVIAMSIWYCRLRARASRALCRADDADPNGPRRGRARRVLPRRGEHAAHGSFMSWGLALDDEADGFAEEVPASRLGLRRGRGRELALLG